MEVPYRLLQQWNIMKMSWVAQLCMILMPFVTLPHCGRLLDHTGGGCPAPVLLVLLTST